MEHAQLDSNPFALMLDPAAVFLAMEKSDRLSRLQSRICRPLDKVVGAASADETPEAEEMIVGGYDIDVS
jgi:hypothetical protein